MEGGGILREGADETERRGGLIYERRALRHGGEPKMGE